MSNDINYMLEKYHPGGFNRYTCPNCGGKKSFTRYVNIQTGEYVSDDCGRCDHESSCGYNYPPRQFFADHPELTKSVQTYSNQKTVLQSKSIQREYIRQGIEQTEFFEPSWVTIGMSRECIFTKWFLTLPFDEERKNQVLTDYYVGGTKEDVCMNKVNYGKAVIFWMIDEQGRVHDAKLMAYTSDGHRVPNWGNYMRSICIKKGIGPQIQETEKVLFGLHLINRFPEKEIGIVESEKTALVCACRYSNILWLATGGCGNLQVSKLRPLMNRRLLVFPDSGEYIKWKHCLEISGHDNFYVTDKLEKYKPNTDLADILLGKGKLKDNGIPDDRNFDNKYTKYENI